MNTVRLHISAVVEQHVEESAFLWLMRDSAVSEPDFALDELATLDNRIEAHLDAISIAGEAGITLCNDALAIGAPGEVFVATVTALNNADGKLLANAVDAAEESDENRRALISAAGWVDVPRFNVFADSLLTASSSLYQLLGMAGHTVRRIDPGARLSEFFMSDSPVLRARALKAAGELQRKDLLPALRNAYNDTDASVNFWAVWSAALLGNVNARKSISAFVSHLRFRSRAMNVYLRVCSRDDAQSLMRGLANDEKTARYAMLASGIVGDPFYIPGLIARMDVPPLARAAGEAFSMITGIDLGDESLELEEPLAEMGPTDDPEDENVEMDEDEDLPWPDKALVAAWWQKNQNRFQPGTRYLCGQPITNENCQRVLREGFQRQRIAAALELTLMQPGTPLFEWRAPGYRQQKLLGLKK